MQSQKIHAIVYACVFQVLHTRLGLHRQSRMFPQRGILFPTDNMEYSMKPTLNHIVDSFELIWELADEQKGGFVLAALGFMPSSTVFIDFTFPCHSCAISARREKAQVQK